MASLSSPAPQELIQVLHKTLLDLEKSAGVPPDDSDLLALKKIVLQRIADLQFAVAQATGTAASATECSSLDTSEIQLSTEAA